MNKTDRQSLRNEYKIQRELEKYNTIRALTVPKTTYFIMVLFLIVFIVLCAGTPILIELLINENKIVFYFVFYFLILEIWVRFLLIKAVECYQHYADKETRLRCLCVPSCSQYAIAVLKRYSIIHAIIKIRIRLTKTCKGDLYQIDLPYKGYRLPMEIEKLVNENNLVTKHKR